MSLPRLALVLLLSLLTAHSHAGAPPPVEVTQTWALESWQPLPGVAAVPAAAPGWAVGTRLVLRGDTLAGPAGLACEQAQAALMETPPEGVFQGAFTTAPARRAQQAGLPAGPVLTLRIDCDNATLDLHRSRSGHWLWAVDGRIARWREATPLDLSPAGVVLAVLVQHQHTVQRPLPGQVQAVRRWLHPQLQRAFDAYLRHPWPVDEVPPLDGDPFTDSQEPPSRLVLGTTQLDGPRAEQAVRVVFDAGDGREVERTLHYVLQRHQGAWRVIDIHGDTDDQRLSAVLAQR